MPRKPLRYRAVLCLAGTLLASAVISGCAVSHTRAVPPAQIRPAREATEAQLADAYNAQARAIRSLNATVRMTTVAGSDYSGVIREYHEIGGFMLMARPELIRIIGQAPVVPKNIFDMVSDGQTFHIFIPSKNQFLEGPTRLERAARSPIENLRPQHILEAFLWPPLPAAALRLFEQADVPPDHYYVLTSLRSNAGRMEIDRKIWFDRADLHIARIQIYGPGGRLDADIAYSDWQPASQATLAESTSAAPAAASADSAVLFPRQIVIRRPQQDYTLTVAITKLALNTDIPAERFVLPQPPGSRLVRVGQDDIQGQNSK